MKKIFGTMTVAAVLFAGYSAYNTPNNIELSRIALTNIEALANSENKQPDINDCIYDKKTTCMAMHPTDSSKDKEKPNYKWP